MSASAGHVDEEAGTSFPHRLRHAAKWHVGGLAQRMTEVTEVHGDGNTMDGDIGWPKHGCEVASILIELGGVGTGSVKCCESFYTVAAARGRCGSSEDSGAFQAQDGMGGVAIVRRGVDI